MTVDELIDQLRELNTGATANVVLTVDGEAYWEIDVSSSRIGTRGEQPYRWDNDFPHALVLHPQGRPI